VRALGLLVKAPDTGLPKQSPWLAIMNRQTEIARKLAAELALPPRAAQQGRHDRAAQRRPPRRRVEHLTRREVASCG
jgi:hypothetical protein